MEDNIIRQQAARIRELEAERDKWMAIANHAEKVRKDIVQRVLNIIPD